MDWMDCIATMTFHLESGEEIAVTHGPDGWQAQKVDGAFLAPEGHWRAYSTLKQDEDVFAFDSLPSMWTALQVATRGQVRSAVAPVE